MPLPKGFDPNNMSFDTVPINIPKKPTAYRNNYYTSSTTRRRPSLWERFNDTIEDIGNWFADHAESVLGTCTMLLMGLIGIGALILVIVTWVNQGLLAAILTAVVSYFVGMFIWFVGYIAIAIFVNLIMYGLRFVFWNGWSFLATLAAGIGCWLWIDYYSPTSDSSNATETEMVATTTETYVCTSKSSLKVRRSPSTKAPKIGNIYRGQEVEVIDITDGFAHIKWNGGEGYASLKYLRKKQ